MLLWTEHQVNASIQKMRKMQINKLLWINVYLEKTPSVPVTHVKYACKDWSLILMFILNLDPYTPFSFIERKG